MDDDEQPDRWFSICGWSIATPEQGCMVEVRYLPEPTAPNEHALSIPLVLTAAQARELSKNLAWLADEAEKRTDLMPQTMQ